MKNWWTIIAALILCSCKPDVYTGPLDNPEGNWEGIKSTYYFNGEQVADMDGCQYSAISFYKQGLCCIEGIKGAFPYRYSGDSLVIDSTIWKVNTLTGAEMSISYLGRIYPDSPAAPDTIETEFNGQAIATSAKGYFYIPSGNDTVYCDYMGHKDEADSLVIDFWYDTHTDQFIPLVVEEKKK